jgi:beta-N-acetylhexosaminidase
MEGRGFDDDDLDFDFDSSRRRYQERETGERPAERRSDTGERPSERRDETGERDYGSEDSREEALYGDEEGYVDPVESTEDRPPRRQRKKRRGFSIPSIGGRRRRSQRTQRRERAADPVPPETEDPFVPEESAYVPEERPYADEEDPFETSERAGTSTSTATPPGGVPYDEDPYNDPFDTGERRARRHQTHRDLPAKVRRRQAIAVGVIAVVVLGGGFLLLSGGGGGGGGDEDEGLPLKKLVGQTFIGKLAGNVASPELIKAARKGTLGGVVVEIANETQAQQAIAQLQKAAAAGDNPPLLTMVDQEGGDVKRFPGGPPTTSPPDLGESGTAETARSEGEQTGSFLAPLGINVDLAPVLDVNIPQTTADSIAGRTYSDDPNTVGELGSAFIQGLQTQKVAATAKHFPGLGAASVNPDDSSVTIAASQEDLDAALVPFQAAVDAGVDVVMMSSAAYPSYAGPTPDEGRVKPAATAEPIVNGLLRGDLGFTGVVITDDLESVAIETLGDSATAGVASLRAGCDMVMYATSLGGAKEGHAEVVKAVKQGRLDQAVVQQAYDRVQTLKKSLATSGE